MNFTEAQNWLLVISGIAALGTSTTAIWQTLKEYRLKLKAEERLTYSAKVQTDLALIQSFGEALSLAHARKGECFSDKIADRLLGAGYFQLDEAKDEDALKRRIENFCVYTGTAGTAEQDGFIVAITELGLQHDILREPVLAALEKIKSFKGESVQTSIDKFTAS